MKSKTKAEEEHLAKVVALGCIVCRNTGFGATPALAHHINAHAMGAKSSHFHTIPLCPPHHQYADGTSKFMSEIAVHKSLDKFEERYGTELELLEQVKTELSLGEL